MFGPPPSPTATLFGLSNIYNPLNLKVLKLQYVNEIIVPYTYGPYTVPTASLPHPYGDSMASLLRPYSIPTPTPHCPYGVPTPSLHCPYAVPTPSLWCPYSLLTLLHWAKSPFKTPALKAPTFPPSGGFILSVLKGQMMVILRLVHHPPRPPPYWVC